MPALHLIQHPITANDFTTQFGQFYSGNDSILFLNDGVFSLLALLESSELLDKELFSGEIFALKEQVDARGLQILIGHERLKVIDYQFFVEITIRTNKTITW